MRALMFPGFLSPLRLPVPARLVDREERSNAALADFAVSALVKERVSANVAALAVSVCVNCAATKSGSWRLIMGRIVVRTFAI